ncbi:DUF1015 family protein [Nonomuraea sp. NPDC049141]|uniref:DUF1015 family protein n=1 Tax=Nonomuraea sp. NPDC049141 TaxID=3155500 RepID=UPI0033D964E0
MGNPELPVPDGLLLRPFRGVRFTVDDPAKVTSPPYDLIADGDVRTLLDAHPNNVVRLILPCSAALKSPEEHPPHPSTASSVTPDDATPIAGTDDKPSVSIPGSLAESTHQSAPDNAVGTRQPQDSMATHDASGIAADDHDNNPSRIPAGHRPGGMPDNPAASQHSGPPEATEQPEGATEQLHDGERPSDERHGAADGDTALQPCGDTPGTSADERYGVARDTLLAWLDAKVLVPDEQPALYVYEQHGPGVLQRGLIGDVALSDPARRIILPHEDIFPGPVADRLALMSTTQANLEPIFLLYDGDRGTTTRLVDHVAATRKPLVTARTEDGLYHRLWAITDPAEIDAVNTDLRTRQALIADGHHRYATYRVLQRQEHAARTGQAPGSWPLLTTPTPAAPQPPGPSSPDTQPHPDTEPEPNSTPRHGTQPNATPTQAPPSQGPTTHEPTTQNPEPTTTPTQNTASDGGPDQEPEPATATSAHGVQPVGQRVHGSEQGQSAFGPWDFGLALLVDSTAYPPDLKAIHRVIPGLPLAEAAARAKGSWRVHDHADLGQGLAALEAAGEPAFLLAGEGGYHLLTNPDPVQLARAMPPDRSDRWNSLNISILSEFVLPKVWGMEDDQQAVRIVHHDPEAALQLALDTGGTAVILKPLAVDDVLAIAAGGERVPRKSTSFGPKPITGLVLRTFATG